MYVCLWSRVWSTGEVPGAEALSALLEVAPRVAVGERGVVWAEGPVRWPGTAGRRDRDGMRIGGPVNRSGGAREDEATRAVARAAARAAATLAETLLERLAGLGIPAWAGVSAVAVAAESAARAAATREGEASRVQLPGQVLAGEGRIVVVEPGLERDFLAPLPLSLLVEDEHLLELLEGVGVETCGALARLAREAVEVRFGAEGAALWRLARADDARRLFRPIPREHPHASLEFVDYVLTDPARLVFTANALLGNVCEVLRRRGEHARRLALILELANGADWRRSLRAVRPTANRETWLRRLRDILDRLAVPDAVAGMRLEVEATEPAGVRQGDLFDPGFESSAAVEAAVARLVETHGEVVVAPETCAHPLPERRTRWRGRSPTEVAEAGGRRGPMPRSPREFRVESTGVAEKCEGGARGRGAGAPPTARRWSEGQDRSAVHGSGTTSRSCRFDEARSSVALTLQLLAEPRRVRVELERRRDHQVPVRYGDGRGWHALLTAAGPDRISGGQWDAPFAREYFRCVSEDGVLLWLFRDAREDAWYLHGWWD